MTAWENASFWSPATMCDGAAHVDELRAGDLRRGTPASPSSVTTSLSLPAHEQRRHPDACQRDLEQRVEVPGRHLRVRPRSMNCGSQCQYQRPSGFWRSTFMSPAGFTRLGRFGV